ncbi:MAG: alpha-glucosidase/alpha-galactosidase [Chloroflexota bacterium]|nr:alpha-glucosidase/alpha-galactosidase [Chloroflexota bacterium]
MAAILGRQHTGNCIVTTRNPKIAIIGAGGVVFPLRLMGDLLSFPALQDATYALMDLDLKRAEHTASEARELASHNGIGAVIEATDDRRAALTNADYVIVTFMVGGTDVYRHDMEIPRKYGVDQRIGDTLGPGGVFRFLRNYPAYAEIACDMHEVCPHALLINYANPMAMNCWYLTELGIENVGLCHSVQGTSRLLAENIDVAYDDITFRCAGINHQAWFLEFQRDGEDLRPAVQRTMTAKYVDEDTQDRGVWGGERVRTEIMNAFGYFHTESSPHASEYLPYFRKNDDLIERYVPIRWDYDEVNARNLARQSDRTLVESLLAELKPSLEYGAWIVNAMESGEPTVIYGNVPNRGLIDNLPADCCVEVACLVDRNGIQPTRFGSLPPQCAAVNQTNINVQRLAVQAALEGKREHVYHAIMLDPLTSAVGTLDQIRAMVDDMFAVEAAWLPPLA